MNRFEEQLHTTAQTIHLSKDERTLMREKMVQYMEMKPIRTITLAKSSSPRFSLKWFNGKAFAGFTRARLVSASLAAVLIISTSAGVSYAAESALPGDTLYPVKVSVNEQVVSALMFSGPARITWLSQLAERRLQEASILTAQGRLDTEKGHEVASRFAAHTAALKAQAQELEKSDPAAAAQASADAATTLEAHEAILARLAVEKDTPAPQATDLVGQVRVAAKAFARLSEDAEEKAFSSTSTAEGTTGTSSDPQASSSKAGATLKENLVIRMRTTARNNIDEAYTLLGRIDNQQSNSALNTKNRIEAIEAAFTEGDELLAHSEYSQAYRAFKDVAADARTITRLLDAEVLFQIEILPPSTNSGATSTGTPQDIRGEAPSLQDTQVAKARTRAQTAIADAQKMILKGSDSTDGGVRAVNALKEAKAFALRGDIAVVTKDKEDAMYLFRQAFEMAERVNDLLNNAQEQGNNEPPDTVSPITPSSTLPDVSSLPPLDVVQVHHFYDNGVHTYSGVFVTPTTCFVLDAQATADQSLPAQVMLTLKTSETNTQCPQQQLDEKPFSVVVQASKPATLKSVMLNGMPTKFVLIEDSAPTSSSTNASSVLNILDR